MYEKLEVCPSCKHPKFNNFKICKDYLTTGESFALVKCAKCQLVYTNPRPTVEAIGKYYKSEEYISHTNNANTLINRLYKIAQIYSFSYKRRIISKYTQPKSILDFGCGTGNFLTYLKSKGLNTYGYEPNQEARNEAERQLKKRIFHTLDEVRENSKYDIITAWHVIEHVHELRHTLKQLRKSLNDGGYLIIALPNQNSADSMFYNTDWAAFDVPRHLYHFNQEAFARLTKAVRLNLVDVHPLKLDAYYVSILSEKNRHNKRYIIEGLKQGYLSNQQAKKTGEYSSLIYILTK